MITINIDEKFLVEKLKNTREFSFEKALNAFQKSSADIKRKRSFRFPSFLLDSKIVAHDFSLQMGLNVPKILEISKSIDDITLEKNVVIKPLCENSARGVYILKKNSMKYLNNNISFNSNADLLNHAKKLLKDGVVRKDLWMKESLIDMDNGAIARDVKFYCFYGEVGLILETKREPELKRCWYDQDLNIVETGKYKSMFFRGDGSLDKLKEVALKISLSIPAPFFRVDLMERGDDIYFGEITPVPSKFHEFNDFYDQKLGRMFIESATRLIYDLSYGKKFDIFEKTIKDEKAIINDINSGLYYDKYNDL